MYCSTQRLVAAAVVERARMRAAIVAPAHNLMAGTSWSIPTCPVAAFGHKRQPRLPVTSP